MVALEFILRNFLSYLIIQYLNTVLIRDNYLYEIVPSKTSLCNPVHRSSDGCYHCNLGHNIFELALVLVQFATSKTELDV